MSGLKRLIDEMKRRHVFRVAVVYAAVAFVIWQAADFVLPALNVPDWVSTVVVILTLLGFPIALVLAWALEITPEGIRRTEPVTGQAVTGRSRGKFSPGPAALIAAFVVLAAFGVWFLALRDSGPTLVRDRIVVVPFENRTGDPAHEQLGGMAAEWIATGLAQAGIFQVVPMRIVNQRLQESASGDELRDLADYTESGTLVTGSFYLRGDSIAFHAELLDAQPRTPALLYAVQPASGPASNPMDAIETVKQRAAGALAHHFSREWERRPELYSPPPSLEAYREFVRGDDLFSRGDWTGATVHFYRALEIDSTYLHPVLHLAPSYLSMGETARADSFLEVYEAQRTRLTPSERAWADYLRGWIDGDLELEYRAAQEGLRIDPFGWRYAAGLTANRSNRPREAEEHLSQKDFSSSFEKQWSPWWTGHLNALHKLGKHEEELEVARDAQVAHPDRPDFLDREAWALAALGRLDELDRLMDEIARRSEEESWSPGTAMRETAIELLAHGHEEAARDLLGRAIGYYESPLVRERAGDPPSVQYRYDLARTLYYAGRWSEARSMFEELVSEYPERYWYLGWLGWTYAKLGERDSALEVIDQLDDFAERPYVYGGPTVWQAEIAALLGERERAINLLREAFERGTHYGDLWIHKAEPFWSLRGYAPFEALVRPKG